MATLAPVQVQYCALCGLPPEFCVYNTEVPHPASGGVQDAPAVAASGGGAAAAAAGVAELTLGGGGDAAGAAAGAPPAGAPTAEGDEAEAPKKSSKSGKKSSKKQVTIERATRNKRKCVTTVIGLDAFGVKLADASKKFGKKFACGASVTKDASNKEQIDVQGDFMDEIAEYICKEWSEVSMDDIKLVDKEKK